MIKEHFGHIQSACEPPHVPTFPIPSREEPRFSCFVESEAAGVSSPLNHDFIPAELRAQ